MARIGAAGVHEAVEIDVADLVERGENCAEPDHGPGHGWPRVVLSDDEHARATLVPRSCTRRV